MSRILDVYLCDNFAGTLTQDNSGDLEFAYDQSYLDATDFGISLSLPSAQKRHKGKVVKAFFSGLLPEESVRERLAGYLGSGPIRFIHSARVKFLIDGLEKRAATSHR